jgi:hypothetical protein
MFKITDYSEINGQVAMTILYSMNGEVKKDERIYDTKENAMCYFASSAQCFLDIQNGKFMKIIHQIKRHYFNNAAVPYINDQRWNVGFWKMLELQTILSKNYRQHHKYAVYMFNNIHLYNGLIPEFIDMQRHELKALIVEIQSTSAQMIKTIEMIHNQTFEVQSINQAV